MVLLHNIYECKPIWMKFNIDIQLHTFMWMNFLIDIHFNYMHTLTYFFNKKSTYNETINDESSIIINMWIIVYSITYEWNCMYTCCVWMIRYNN